MTEVKKGPSLMALAMLKIADAYDYDAQCYGDKATDDAIAKEVGCSPVFVAKLRAEHFGPAHKPKPVTIEDRVKAMEDAVSIMAADIARILDAMTQPPKLASPGEARRSPRDKSVADQIMKCMTNDWQSTAAIRGKCGVAGYAASTLFCKMRADGLIESKPDTFAKGGRPMNLWRLKAKPNGAHAVMGNGI